MKATFDIPEDLIRRLKLRAIREGGKLKEVIADVLRAGLAVQANEPASDPPVVGINRKTGLPAIQCRRSAPKGDDLNAERVADILMQQEVGWARESS